MRTRSLKVGSIAYWEDRIEARVRQEKGYNIPHARDVISRGQRVLRLVALAEMERFLWPKTASAAALPTAPAPPATPAKPAAPRLSIAAPIGYVVEGTALAFGSTGHPRDAHTLQACQASVRCRAFDSQIDQGDVVLAVEHAYHGDVDDAAEVLANQRLESLKLWTSDLGRRLHFRARLSDTALARRLLAKAEQGALSGVSVCYAVRSADRYGDHEATTAGTLREISILFADESRPAFPGTTCRVLHAPIGLSIHDPEFRRLSSDTAIGAARKQLRVLRG